MFSFLAGVFGSLFYGARYIAEKEEHKRIDMEFLDKNKLYYELEQRLSAPDRGKEIIEYIYSGENFNEICEKYHEELKFVFGDNYKDIIPLPPHQDRCSCEAAEEVGFLIEQLILACEGKCIFIGNSTIDGLIVVGRNNIDIGGKSLYDVSINVAQCIEQSLHRNGHSDILLELELDYDKGLYNPDGTWGRFRLPKDENKREWQGAVIKDKRLAVYPTIRIW